MNKGKVTGSDKAKGNKRRYGPGPINGRPRKMLTVEQIAELRRMANVGARRWEMARAMGMEDHTLAHRIKDQFGVQEAIEGGRADLNISLRRKQIVVALTDGHAAQGTMLVWTGKTILGQNDRVSVKIETDEEARQVLSAIFPDLNIQSLEEDGESAGAE